MGILWRRASEIKSHMPQPWKHAASPERDLHINLWLRRFLDGSKSEEETTKLRNGAFKIIPRVAEGSWVIKQSVGQNTPVLLGRKLTTKYFRWGRCPWI